MGSNPTRTSKIVVDLNSGLVENLFLDGENMFKDDVALSEFLEFLGDLSLEGESFEICLAALKLQSALKEIYPQY